MNKQLFRKSLTSFAIASTMLFSAAAPAFATDTGTTSDLLHPHFNKVVQVQDDDTYQPKEIFKFKVIAATPEKNETRYDMKVSEGKGQIDASGVETDPNEHGNHAYTTPKFDLSKLTTAQADNTQPAITQPGIYKYTVTEEKGTNPDMVYDDATRYLYVFVKRNTDGSLSVYNSQLVDSTDAKEKSQGFINKYGVDDNNNGLFKDLTIKKEVTGAMGDTQKVWNFDLTLTSGSNRSTYVVELADKTKTTLKSGETYKFTLKSGESIKVENLSTTDTYTVTEDESGLDNYKTTGEVKDAKNMADEDVTETITNKRDEVTPTGIMMMYGPYALMVALAGALGLFVAKKHRAEEE